MARGMLSMMRYATVSFPLLGSEMTPYLVGYAEIRRRLRHHDELLVVLVLFEQLREVALRDIVGDSRERGESFLDGSWVGCHLRRLSKTDNQLEHNVRGAE